MKQIILDGRCLKEKDRAHRYLQKKFDFPEHYGKNLDALWDLLTENAEPVEVKVRYSRSLQEEAGYGARILRVLSQAAEEMESFSLVLA